MNPNDEMNTGADTGTTDTDTGADQAQPMQPETAGENTEATPATEENAA